MQHPGHTIRFQEKGAGQGTMRQREPKFFRVLALLDPGITQNGHHLGDYHRQLGMRLFKMVH